MRIASMFMAFLITLASFAQNSGTLKVKRPVNKKSESILPLPVPDIRFPVVSSFSATWCGETGHNNSVVKCCSYDTELKLIQDLSDWGFTINGFELYIYGAEDEFVKKLSAAGSELTIEMMEALGKVEVGRKIAFRYVKIRRPDGTQYKTLYSMTFRIY